MKQRIIRIVGAGVFSLSLFLLGGCNDTNEKEIFEKVDDEVFQYQSEKSEKKEKQVPD